MPIIDQKDLDIVMALEKYGPKKSTEELSNLLNIPSRTIRYRLAKLEKKGLLQPLHIMTHERKIGLGEHIILLQENHKKHFEIIEILQSFKNFYYFSQTYGKFNGILVHSVFNLKDPDTNLKIVKEMKKCELIEDYFIFEMVDYYFKTFEITKYNPNIGLKWNWDEWIYNIKNDLIDSVELILDLEANSKIQTCDYLDVKLLKQLEINPKSSLSQIKKVLNLSKTQISRRIKKLEEKNVIRGFKPVFTPTSKNDLILLYCFMDIDDSFKLITTIFSQIPFSFMFSFESKNKCCIKLDLTSRDIKFLLKGFNLLKRHLRSYFFQYIHDIPYSQLPEVFDLFDKDENTWKIDISSILTKINKVK